MAPRIPFALAGFKPAVEPACASGCTIVLENGELYEMSGGEQVSIEGGVIFVDVAPQASSQAQ